jgi:hypothetical protein
VDYTHGPLLTRSAEWRFARTMFLMSLVRSTFRQGYRGDPARLGSTRGAYSPRVSADPVRGFSTPPGRAPLSPCGRGRALPALPRRPCCDGRRSVTSSLGRASIPALSERFPGFSSAHALHLPFVVALTGTAPALKLVTTWFPHSATPSGCSRASRAAREPGSSTKNASASIGKLTHTSALGYRAFAISTARRMLRA